MKFSTWLQIHVYEKLEDSFIPIPGVAKKVHNFVQVLFTFETIYVKKLCLVW